MLFSYLFLCYNHRTFMRRVIHKIRLQPPEFRMMVAVVAALVLTGIIAALWAQTLSVEPKTIKTNAPRPFDALVENVKGVFTSSTLETTSIPSGNTVEIIDAGVSSQSSPSSQHDESNPASASASSDITQ